MPKKPYAISAYETAQRTTPPLQAVVMLYDGILRRLREAAEAAKEGNLPRQLEASIQVVRILDGLDRSLDMERGGKVAMGLRETYRAVAGALVRAASGPTGPETCVKLLRAMSELRDAWAEIAGVPLLGTGKEDRSDAGAR